MSDALVNGWRGAVAVSLRSYVGDLRRWITRLAAGYAVAGVLLVGSVLALFAAIAVGITALFHLIERYYGTGAAYGGVGGGLLALAIVLLLSGVTILRRKMPPLPRPLARGQKAKRRSIDHTASRSVISRVETELAQTDPMTRLLIGASVTMLVGWMVASRRERGR